MLFPRRMTRRELYDLVWSMPLPEAAETIGLPTFTLQALCDAHRVPKPNLTYWKNKVAGKPVREIHFVSTADPTDELIVIETSDPPPAIHSDAASGQRRAPPRTTRVSTPTPVVDRTPLETPHRHIAATVRELRSKLESQETVQIHGERIWSVSIGSASIERVIRIMDAVVRALTAKGCDLGFWQRGITGRTQGETVCFRITEHTNRMPHALTPMEQEREFRRKLECRRTGEPYVPYGWYQKYDYRLNGVLTLTMSESNGWGCERVWKDGVRKTIEDRLDELPDAIDEFIAARIEARRVRECEHRNAERRRRCADRARQRGEREAARRKVLDELVDVTSEAAALRAWLGEVETWQPSPDAVEFERLVDWSRRRLASLDGIVTPSGVARRLRERGLFPDVDPLVDPPEDLAVER